VCFVFLTRFYALDPGTYWWHSHAGLQRSNGLFGHLVVRQPPSRDPYSAFYDYDLAEHVISVTDWLIEMSENRFASHHHDDGDNKPASMLINGKTIMDTHPAHRDFRPPLVCLHVNYGE
jgi:FtsP/CotA-like multicopper oxidase with cupredoxin domain